jgi:adenosylmethionine-8-amino-7-oxononanoate aminotransferase
VAASHIAAPFFDEPGNIFRHGYTYSGHAACCAAGLAVMDIIEREDILSRAMELETEIPAALAPLADIGVVTGIRAGVGALAAIQLETGDDTLAPRAAKACRDAGVLTRAVGGGGLQVSPPLVLTPDELTEMAEKFAAGLESL